MIILVYTIILIIKKSNRLRPYSQKSSQSQYSEMFKTIYISDLQDLPMHHHPDTQDLQYKIPDNENKIICKNITILYALAVYLFGEVTRDIVRQVDNQQICFGDQDRQKAIFFMSKATGKILKHCDDDVHAMVMLQYFREENKCYDVKMILKFMNDVDFTSTLGGNKAQIYIIIYFYNEMNQSLISSFSFHKQPIPNLGFKRKLQFLGLLQCTQKSKDKSQFNNSSNVVQNYGFGDQGCGINWKIIQLAQQQQSVMTEKSSAQISISMTNSNADSNMNHKSEYLIVYGKKSLVQRFITKLNYQLQQIQFKTFKCSDPFYTNIVFTAYRSLSSDYKKCRTYNIENRQSVQIYFHRSIAPIFHRTVQKSTNKIQGFFDYQHQYKAVRTATVRHALKDKNVMEIIHSTPDAFIYSDSVQGEMFAAGRQLVEYVEKCNNNIRKARKAEKSEATSTNLSPFSKKLNPQQQQIMSPSPTRIPINSIISPIHEKQQMDSLPNQPISPPSVTTTIQQQQPSPISQRPIIPINDTITDFLPNLQLTTQEHLKQLFQHCTTLKMQQDLSFKIDIGEFIRINNRAKKSNIIYVVFQDPVQLMRLQTVIQQQIDVKQFQSIIRQYQSQVFHKPKTIITKHNTLTLNLHPMTQQLLTFKQKYFHQLLQTIKQDKKLITRTLLCSLQTLQQLLSTIIINFNIIFTIYLAYPAFHSYQFDQIFQRQTNLSRIRNNRMHLQYYCQVRSQVVNKDYRNMGNYKKDQAVLKSIYTRNLHQYQIGNYMLSQIDQYNIAFMIAENVNMMFITLSKKPTQEYIYLTYHQKLIKVLRDKNGNFDRFQDASMKQIDMTTEKILRPALQRAFLIGQKYFTINLPFEHVKAVSIKDVLKLPDANQNLVQYYLKRMTESQRFKVCLKSPCTSEYFRKRLAKNYTIKFDSKQMKKEIKILDLGYASIKKWREDPFICMRADHFICEKILKKFETDFQNKSKK